MNGNRTQREFLLTSIAGAALSGASAAAESKPIIVVVWDECLSRPKMPSGRRRIEG